MALWNEAVPIVGTIAALHLATRGIGALPEGIDDKRYLEVLGLAQREIEAFKPAALVVSLGYDIMRGDPTGAFTLSPPGLTKVGEAIGRLGLPVLVVQEGGYLILNLSRGAAGFFAGMARTWY